MQSEYQLASIVTGVLYGISAERGHSELADVPAQVAETTP